LSWPRQLPNTLAVSRSRATESTVDTEGEVEEEDGEEVAEVGSEAFRKALSPERKSMALAG
jgi:hypothetical protein